MKILQLHCNFIEYEPIAKEIPSAEEAEKKKVRVDEVVVLFTSVEKGDNEPVAKKAVDDTKSYLDQIKSNRILLYPYAHLSKDLAPPADALKVLLVMEIMARELGLETMRTPFGWNKQFTISIKGQIANHFLDLDILTIFQRQYPRIINEHLCNKLFK